MIIQAAALSFAGGREYNEDAALCVTRGGLCAAVTADGLGGHGGGEIASGIVVKQLTEPFLDDPEITPERIKQMFENANSAVLDAQTPYLKMKSTGAALYVNGYEAAYIYGHTGDTRLYKFIDGGLAFRTLDHSVPQAAVYAGEITPDEIRFHPDRNRLLRAFGDDAERFRADISGVMRLTRDFYAFLLCTDGFWEYVYETEMEIELSKAETPDGWLRGMLWRIIGRAPKKCDNYSASAVFIMKG